MPAAQAVADLQSRRDKLLVSTMGAVGETLSLIAAAGAEMVGVAQSAATARAVIACRFRFRLRFGFWLRCKFGSGG